MAQTPRPGVAGQQKLSGDSRREVKGHRRECHLSSRRKVVLVIDDEPELTAMLAEVFSQDDYVVDTAAHGEDALQQLAQRTYDAILCDIRMPGLNGPGFYRAIEQRHPELLSRVLFVTGDILSPETQAFLQRTDAPALEKPFALEEIRTIVRHIIQAAERR